jgi:hypothetical protein
LTVDEVKRRRILSLGREGHPHRAIAEETGASRATVGRILRAEGLTGGERTERTREATLAAQARMRAARVDQAAGLLDDLSAARERLPEAASGPR